MNKKWKAPKETINGYVYILKIYAPHGVVYKIGTTNRTVKVRVLEIAGELMEVLGHIPKMEVLRQKQTKLNYKVEAKVLEETKQNRCTLGFCEWNGESELRKMDEPELLRVYDVAVAEDFAPDKKFKVEL